jgi:hypothetical protein
MSSWGVTAAAEAAAAWWCESVAWQEHHNSGCLDGAVGIYQYGIGLLLLVEL